MADTQKSAGSLTTDSNQGAQNQKNRFTGVRVFSATMAQERDQLGEKITAWLRANPHCQIVDKIVTQSSDEAFHCLAITLFYREEK